MRRDLVSAALAVVALTAVLGLAYPLLVTGLAHVAWPHQAGGSRVPGGSSLLAKPVLRAGKPDPRYFQPRPSADGYDPAATAFSNRGPNQRSAAAFYREQLTAYLALNRPYDPELTAREVPIDAVTTSASGVDPHISPGNARIQARRVAELRRLPLARVLRLVARHTDGRFFGVLGEPGVNVTTLNRALDGRA